MEEEEEKIRTKKDKQWALGLKVTSLSNVKAVLTAVKLGFLCTACPPRGKAGNDAITL